MRRLKQDLEVDDNMKTWKGNPVSPGIVCGKAYLYRITDLDVAEAYCGTAGAEEQLRLFEKALTDARGELDRLIASFPPAEAEKSKIFAAHKEILDDEELLGEVRRAIGKDGKCADFAIKTVFDEFIGLLAKVRDPLIAARAADLRDVRNRMLRVLQGKPEQNLSCLPADSIVVAHDLLPSETATLDRAHVVGIVAETGGSTSHTAILARNFRIPAVLGVEKALELLQEEELLALDGEAGTVFVSPDGETMAELRRKAAEFHIRQAAAEGYLGRPAATRDGVAISVGVNVGSDAFTLPADCCDFVGLFRTEFLYMQNDHLPTENEQFEAYRRVLESAGGRPVTLRTLDIGGDKTLPYFQLPREANPFLGRRALRLCFDHPEVFRTQLRAALRASAFGPLQIMFPMVGSIDDIRRAKAAVGGAMNELRAEEKPFQEDIRLGIMIEIPSIAATADLAAREVDFASVGTNDLTQYLCAADRMNPGVASYYQQLSPAMMRTLRGIFHAFDGPGKPVSVCGELAGDPAAVVILVGLGLRKFSMSEANIGRVKQAIAGVTLAQAQEWAKACLEMTTQEEIRALLHQRLS